MKYVTPPPGERSWSTIVAGYVGGPHHRSGRRGSPRNSHALAIGASNFAVTVIVSASRFFWTLVTVMSWLPVSNFSKALLQVNRVDFGTLARFHQEVRRSPCTRRRSLTPFGRYATYESVSRILSTPLTCTLDQVKDLG